MIVVSPIRFAFGIVTLFVAGLFAFAYYNQLHGMAEDIDLSTLQLGLMARMSFAWVIALGALITWGAYKHPMGILMTGMIAGIGNIFLGMVLMATPLQWSGDFGLWAAVVLMAISSPALIVRAVQSARVQPA